MSEQKFYDCIDCHGSGMVVACTGDGEEHSWECPECYGAGRIPSAVQHAKQAEAHEAFARVKARYGGSAK